MKICMLVSRVPWPLEKGDKLRAYHQLRELCKHHEVHLMCLSDGTVDELAIDQLKKITPHVFVYRLNRFKMLIRMCVAFFSRKPFQVHYFYEHSVARKIRTRIEDIKPDFIYCQLVRCSEYVKHLHHYKKTIDYMDALSAGLKRRLPGAPWYAVPFVKEEARRLTAYEHLVFDYFEHHTIISDQDRKLIYHSQRNRVHVVPNGIDAIYFRKNSTGTKSVDLVFTGNMSYPPNVEGARRLALVILPLVRKVYPNVKLQIAGATPASSVLALASDSVVVTGWLDDIREAYNNARVFVAPMLSGSGMQNKLLEAMSMELPCVTTELAAAPLGVTHEKECLVGRTDEELAEGIIKLLSDDSLAKQIACAGRNYVIQHFDWAATVKILEDTCFNHSNS